MATRTQLSLARKMGLIVLIPLIPLSGLLVFGVRNVRERQRVIAECKDLISLSEAAVGIGNAVHELQKERGRSSGLLGSKGRKFGPELQLQREATDRALAAFRDHPQEFVAGAFGHQIAETMHRATSMAGQLPKHRERISRLEIGAPEAIRYYSDFIGALLDVATYMSKVSTHTEITTGVIAYVNLLQAKERIGIERATLSNAFAAGGFQGDMYPRFLTVLAGRDIFLKGFRSYATPDQIRFFEATVQGPAVEEVRRVETMAVQGQRGQFDLTPEHWFTTVTEKIDRMKRVEDKLAGDLKVRASTVQADAEAALRNLFIMLGALILSLAATGVLTRLTARSITRPITRLIGELGQGASQVADQAARILSTSQSLARDAGTSASSLEETAAALESMTGNTRNSVSRANLAKKLSAGNRNTAEEGARDVIEMAAAMKAVKTASRDISKIAKLIDGIAFQTNILSLNAAVEAARAGQAGVGFSVVAAEVQALARNSADAAKEAENLVGQALLRTDSAMQACDKVSIKLKQIAAGALDIDGLIAEISANSENQNSSIGQVNVAMNEINQAVGATASAADTSSTRAEELASQAAVFERAVGRLSSLVGYRE